MTSIPSGILVHPAVWPQRTLAENWGGGNAPLGGQLDPHLLFSVTLAHGALQSGLLFILGGIAVLRLSLIHI